MKPDNLRSMRHLTIAAVLILALGVTRSLLARPEAAGSGNPPLHTVADIPMPGPAVRFDYQSLDQDHSFRFRSALGIRQFFYCNFPFDFPFELGLVSFVIKWPSKRGQVTAGQCA